ncbi:MAG: translocation/assembly module TamB domain-containing protein [Candidatus Eiseniibacteriota bacterium]|jgi:hypothetical protein
MSVRMLLHRVSIGLAMLMVVILALAAVLAIVELTVGSRTLATRIAELVTGNLLGEETRLRIVDLEGNGLTHLTLHGVALEVREEDGRWRPWCQIAAVRLDYDLRDLLASDHHLRRLTVRGVRVDDPGTRPPPRFRGGGRPDAETARGAEPYVRIDSLHVVPVVVSRGGEAVASAEISGSLAVARDFVALDIRDSRLSLPDQQDIALRGPVELRGSAVYLGALTMDSGGSRVQASGWLDGLRGASLRLELAPLDIADWAPVIGWREVERPAWVRGVAELDGSWEALDLEWRLRARFGDDRVEALVGRGRLAAGALDVERVELELGGVPLSGRGRLGLKRGENSWGELRFSGVPLASFPVLRDQAWLPAGQLSGTVRVGSPVGAVRPFELRVSRGSIHGFVLEPGYFAGGIGQGGVVQLDSVVVATRGARLTGHGTIDPAGGIDLRHDVVLTDLQQAIAMFADSVAAAGNGRLRLAIIGPLRAPAFSVSGRLDSLELGALALSAVDLSLGPGILGRQPTADLDLTAASGRIGGRRLGPLSVSGSLREQRLRIAALRLALDGTTVGLRGQVDWAAAALEVRLDDLELQVGERSWRSIGVVSGQRRGARWRLEPVTLRSDAGTVSLAATVDGAQDRLAVEVVAEELDLAALGDLPGMPPASGTVDLELNVRGPRAALTWDVDLRARALTTPVLAAERLELTGTLAGRELAFEHLLVERGGRVTARGAWRFPVAVASPDGWGALARAGTWRDAEVTVTAESSGLDLAAWHGVAAPLGTLDGTVAFLVELDGPAARPDGRATVGAQRLAVGDEVLTDLEAQLRFEAGRIDVAEVRTTVRGASLVVHGSSPVWLSLTAAPRLDRTAPLGLTVELEPGDLALAPFVSDRAVDTAGPVHGWVRVTGSIAAPRYHGEIEVRDATLRPRGREEVLREVQAHILLEGDAVHISELQARVGEDGRLEADGTLRLVAGKVDAYIFHVRFDHVPVTVTGEYYAELTGTLTYARGPGVPRPLPEVEAELTVERLSYLREVVGRHEGPPRPSSWVGTIDVEFPRNAWIRNEDLEVEFRGDVRYERSPAGATMLGSLELIRGRYDLFGRTFRITRGDIDFVDPLKIDPELDVEAETRLPEGRVTATIAGRASDRQLSLTADDEDLDQATLWAMLVPSAGADVSNLVAMTPFIRDLERRLSREVPGMTVSFELTDPETGAQGGLGARVGTYVSTDVFVSAYQGFVTTTDQDVAVEYQLSDIVFLKGEAVRRGVREGGSEDVEEEYNLNLNFRWEF